MNILIDGMGGDNAPREIVKGAILAAGEIREQITLIGPEDQLRAELDRQGWDGENIALVQASQVISNREAPAMAVRKYKDATITKGMRLLKAGEADVFISGGSTGALLSAGLLTLGRIKGVKRPAIAAFFPKIGKNDTTLLLDCGANVEGKPEYLQQFGVMGSIFVQNVKGIREPEVKLLNVGAEDEKGDQLHKEAFRLLQESPIHFCGNVEGRDVCFGVCDVVVADGFSGNVFLKSSEGVALAIMKRVKEVMLGGSAVSKLTAALFAGRLRGLKREFDYSEEGGAPILGLKGAVLKIHGSSRANAVYNAIRKAVPYVASDVTGQIERTIAASGGLDQPQTSPEQATDDAGIADRDEKHGE